jgi:hypothetical protein
MRKNRTISGTHRSAGTSWSAARCRLVVVQGSALRSRTAELLMELMQRGWLASFAQQLFDALCALHGRQQRCIQFEVVDAMAMDLLIMRVDETGKPITACMFSLFGDLQGATDTDKNGMRLEQSAGSGCKRAWIEDDIIHDHMIANSRERGNRLVHANFQLQSEWADT